MLVEKKESLVEIITGALPYPEQIGKWDWTSETDAVRFTWRGNKFRVGMSHLSVEEVGNGVLIGSDISILLEKLIKLSWFEYDRHKLVSTSA